jgi:hypothetical protein
MQICNHDCFNCKYADCIAPDDDITRHDSTASNHLDRYARDYEELTAIQRAQKKYAKSAKGKETIKRYRQTEKGKISSRKAVKKYQAAHREKINQAYRDYYAKNAERINKRRRELRAKRRLEMEKMKQYNDSSVEVENGSD